MNKQSTDLG